MYMSIGKVWFIIHTVINIFVYTHDEKNDKEQREISNSFFRTKAYDL